MTEAVLPAYLVKGDDPSLVSQSLETLVSTLAGADTSGLGVEDFSSEDPDVGAIIDACLTLPFLVERRTVVVRELGRLPAAEVDRLVSYLEAPSDTASLVLASSSAVAPRLVNAVKAVGRVVDAATPSGRGRHQWLAGRLREAPIRLEGAATERLGAHLGEDLGRLNGLLGALTAAYGPGARLGVEDLEPFLGEAGSTAPWELTDAIDRGDAGGALAALHRLMGAGQRHPLVVLGTLHRHFANLARLDGAGAADDAAAAALLGSRSTFAAGKARLQAGRLGHSAIAQAFGYLAQADLDLRGASAVPAGTVMEILVARLARLSPRPRRATRSRRSGR